MEVTRISDIDNYITEAQPMLLKKEAANNLPLGIINQLNTGRSTSGDGTYLGIVRSGTETVYAFIQTPAHNLILPDAESIDSAVISAIAVHLYNENISLPGVIGPAELSLPFAEKWSELTEHEFNLKMNQLIYRLDHVNKTRNVKGELIKAEKSEMQLAATWLNKFGEEADAPLDTEEANDMAHQFINNGSLYFWKVDGMPVSMVNQSRKTPHGTSVNAVFTPDEYKRHGYATAAVAALSRQLLKEGFQFCSLYTDSDNPTANHIYKQIGYYTVGTSTVYHFK